MLCSRGPWCVQLIPFTAFEVEDVNNNLTLHNHNPNSPGALIACNLMGIFATLGYSYVMLGNNNESS